MYHPEFQIPTGIISLTHVGNDFRLKVEISIEPNFDF